MRKIYSFQFLLAAAIFATAGVSHSEASTAPPQPDKPEKRTTPVHPTNIPNTTTTTDQTNKHSTKFPGDSHSEMTTTPPLPEAEPTSTGNYDNPSGKPEPHGTTPEGEPEAWTQVSPTTSPSMNLTEFPDGAVKFALERIDSVKSEIVDQIPNFNPYVYDGLDVMIVDGGADMYDEGNLVYFTVGGLRTQIRYGHYYSGDDYEFGSTKRWPFVALMHVSNIDGSHRDYGIRVESDVGADGFGNSWHFSGNSTSSGINVAYSVSQVYGAGSDPSICEVYVAFSESELVNKSFSANLISRGTMTLKTEVTIKTPTDDIWMGYYLLSKRNGALIQQYEIDQTIRLFVSAALGSNYTVPFVFSVATAPVTPYPTTTVTPYPTTTHSTTSSTPFTNNSTPNIPSDIPFGSATWRAFEAFIPVLKIMTNSISNFNLYPFDDGSDMAINDGNDDMYDGGNKVHFWVNNESKTRIRYQSFYSRVDSYEFSSLKSHPFVALMHINNTFRTVQKYSIQVTGDAGADGSGFLTHFNSSASAYGINVAYAVTQVYDASDPSICEVYMAFSNEHNVEGNFVIHRDSSSTNNLDSSITLEGFPRNSWMAYILLSRRRGQVIYPQEIGRVVSEFVGAIFGYNNIPFSFPPSPTFGPATTTASTYPPYRQQVFVGFRQEVCGTTKIVQQNITQCAENQTAFVTHVVVEMMTSLGYLYPAEGTISGCMESQLCGNGCSSIRNVIGYSQTILSCKSRCCYSSYCNRRYDPHNYYSSPPSNFTPPNITIPASSLSDVSIEVFPNCFFKSLGSRLKGCWDNMFNAWPFSSKFSCKSAISSAVRCGSQELAGCRTDDLFSSAMFVFSSATNWDEIIHMIEQTSYLDLLCVISADDIRNATIGTPGLYNTTQYFPLFPRSPIGFGEPYCDRFIVDSLLDWNIEFLSVLKTSTSKLEMCRAFKLVINRVLDAAENRCDLDLLASSIPCDSVLRNQIRALVVQAKEILPNIAPDYCEGVEPPVEPETPDDIPFLPSCTLRQAVKSVWSCESVFTSKAPYSDSDICKTNINRLLHCVANRLQECATGGGYSFFDSLEPFVRFEDILAAIRSLTHPVSCNGSRTDFREVLCSSSVVDLRFLNFHPSLGSLFSVCRGNASGVFQNVAQAYFTYAGARNSADVCTAFRSVRDWMHQYFRNNCDLSVLRYLLPIDPTVRNALSYGSEILIEMLPELEISVCPEPPSGNKTFSPTRWLRSYIRWRSYTLPKWQAAFVKWRSENGDEDAEITMPVCVDHTRVTCKNSGMKVCESDYFGCAFCHCSDDKYKDLTKTVMQPWLEDYDNWENFQTLWETKFADWQENND